MGKKPQTTKQFILLTNHNGAPHFAYTEAVTLESAKAAFSEQGEIPVNSLILEGVKKLRLSRYDYKLIWLNTATGEFLPNNTLIPIQQ